MGFGTNGFGAGGIGDGVITTAKVEDDSQTQLGTLSLQPTQKSKVCEWNFDTNAIDTTRWTSTVVNGTNTATTTGMMGYIVSSTTSTANRSAKMVSTTQLGFSTGTGGNLIEFYVRIQNLNATTGKIQFVISPTIDGTKTANSIGLGYNITGGAVGWEFYTTDTGNTAETDTGLTFTTSAYHMISFLLSSNNTLVQCFVDGVQVGTTHSTNIPTMSTAVNIGWFISNSAEASLNSCYVASIKAIQRRN